jgi:hypothetical protein
LKELTVFSLALVCSVMFTAESYSLMAWQAIK